MYRYKSLQHKWVCHTLALLVKSLWVLKGSLTRLNTDCKSGVFASLSLCIKNRGFLPHGIFLSYLAATFSSDLYRLRTSRLLGRGVSMINPPLALFATHGLAIAQSPNHKIRPKAWVFSEISSGRLVLLVTKCLRCTKLLFPWQHQSTTLITSITSLHNGMICVMIVQEC